MLSAETLARVREIVGWTFEEHGANVPGEDDRWYLDSQLEEAIGEASAREQRISEDNDNQRLADAEREIWERDQIDLDAEIAQHEDARAFAEGPLDDNAEYDRRYAEAHRDPRRIDDDIPF